MKNIICKLLCTICVLTVFLSICNLSESKTAEAASNLTTITMDNGTTLTYRNSSEQVKKLKDYDYPTQELRACWVSLFVSSLPSYTSEEKWKTDYSYVLDTMEAYGLNCIIFHVRTHNNALYKSELNPIATWFKNVNFDQFDPLAWAIEETHKRGMEFHAWLNPYRVLDKYVGEDYPSVNPACDPSNILTSGSNSILDPGLPNVRKFLVDTCMEVVENYDVDAIHFDDYFYISGVDDSATRSKYNTEGLSIGDFRRKQVDLFIESLSQSLRAYNEKNQKAVSLGISPSGIYQNGGYAASPSYDSNGNISLPLYSNTSGFAHYDNYLYSDTLNWINHEWIDYIMPQAYWALGHTSASFAALSRWWSWAVRNKKVNLYMGMGIYMAESTTGSGAYWQLNQNEIRDQILNAATYDEIGGISLYSYNYIQSSNSIIKSGMTLLKNDYFKTKIPCDVKKYYADILPSTKPKGLVINSNVLTIDSVDNIRGYIVYKVSKGAELDKSDISQVFYYGTSNSITLDNLAGYDYYVATVNYANVISDTVSTADGVIDGNKLVSLINSLPSNITLEDKESVQNIVDLYNELSSEEKAKVTNYNVLTLALAKIAALEELKEEAIKFTSSINNHIVNNRKLPTRSDISWHYVNSADQEAYDITTGERKKNYLDKHLINLILRITDGTYTYDYPYVINTGLTDVSETGLFYRNDPSCMSEVDAGAIKPTDSKYIGWSGVTIKFGDKVLYVAVDNYFDLSSDTITKANWTSCAAVVLNNTGSNLSFTYSKLFDSKSGNDSYLIVRDDKVVEAGVIGSLTDTVQLQNGDYVIVLRYLDNLNFGSNLFPVSKYLNTKLSLTDYNKQDSDEVQAQKMIDEINNLPDANNVQLADEEKITIVYNKYNLISEEAKALVTNKDKLIACYKKVYELKEEYENLQYALEEGKRVVSNYVELTDYSKANQAVISELIKSALNSLDNAKTEAEVKTIVDTFKSDVNRIKPYTEDIEGKRTDAIDEINAYINLTNYSDTQKQVIDNLLQAAINSINKETDLAAIDELVKQFKKDYDKVPNIEEELAIYKQTTLEEIKSSIDLSLYKVTDQDTINNLFNTLKQNVNNAKSITEVNNYVNKFKVDFKDIPTLEEALNKSREEKISELSDVYNGLDKTNYSAANLNLLQTIFADGKANINKATNSLDISDAFINAKNALLDVETIDQQYALAINDIKTELGNYKTSLLSNVDDTTNRYKNGLEKVLNDYLNDVNSLEKQEVIRTKNTIISDGKRALDNEKESITNLINAILEANERLNSVDTSKAGTKDLVNSFKESVNNAKSKSEVESLLIEFDNEYQALTKKKGCFDKGSILVSLISSISLLYFVLYRKEH